MAWTAPMTASAGGTFTAANFNTHIRDNLNETMPAKASVASAWLCASGANALVQRQFSEQFIGTAETRTSSTYGDLATVGPTVTVTTGTFAIVHMALSYSTSADDSAAAVCFVVSGATTIAASDDNAIWFDGATASNINLYSASFGVTLTGGSNTFKMQYRVGGGTGTFDSRRISVWTF